MKIRLQFAILFSLFASATCFATSAITEITSAECHAASNTCTIGTVAVGDLGVVYAERNASTTAPTLPSGWTSIYSTGANSEGIRVACAVATGTSLTMGTWTNATHVHALIFRGTAAGTTANCTTTGIGGQVVVGGATQTVMTWGTVTMTKSDGSSWVIGCGMGSAATSGQLNTQPTGMTLINQTGSAPGSNCSGTNGGVSSWSSQSISSLTSGNVRTYTMEILSACTGLCWSVLHSAILTSCGFVSSCAITVTSTSTGSLLYIGEAGGAGGGTISSINNDTWVVPGGCANSTAISGSCAYVLSSASGNTSFTVTLTAAATHLILFYVEIGLTGGSGITLDKSGNRGVGGETNPAGVTLSALTGTKDVIIQHYGGTTDATAISSPFTEQQHAGDATVFGAIATSLNTTSVTAPTWTAAFTNDTLGALAFYATASGGTAVSQNLMSLGIGN